MGSAASHCYSYAATFLVPLCIFQLMLLNGLERRDLAVDGIIAGVGLQYGVARQQETESVISGLLSGVSLEGLS